MTARTVLSWSASPTIIEHSRRNPALSSEGARARWKSAVSGWRAGRAIAARSPLLQKRNSLSPAGAPTPGRSDGDSSPGGRMRRLPGAPGAPSRRGRRSYKKQNVLLALEVAPPAKRNILSPVGAPTPGRSGCGSSPGLFCCADNQRRKLNRLNPLTLTKLCCAACNTMLCMLSRLSASA